jgi:hypothetical protein
MWESRRDFQRVWEGWKAGFMAFHAFHTLSFPRPDLECAFKSEVTEIPVSRELATALNGAGQIHHGRRCYPFATTPTIDAQRAE